MKIRLHQPQTLIWLLFIFVGYSLASHAQTPVYSFTVPTDGTGYDAVGNLKAYTDTVTGTWSMQYDNLNRLKTAGASTGPYTGVGVTWTYDSFGNRKDQSVSGTPSVPVNEYHASFDDASNRMTNNGSGTPPIYDDAGNLRFDGRYRFAYDAENRLCAVYDTVLTNNITQYLYDAEGHRVAKGHPVQATTTPVCTTGGSDFMPTEKYILGPNGEQITEFLTQPDGSDVWQHTNVYGNGQLIATYNQSGTQQLLHFNITDPLGTKRIQTNAAGTPELNCLSLPFGDGPPCTGTGMEATEHRFTGKERDTESGNDYFGARYYGSNMGRFMSPDPSGLTYADITNPQSLNLYSYALNNPLKFIDPTGMYCFYGGKGDTVENDSDPSDYDFTSEGTGECSSTGGQWIDNPSTTVTVSAGGDNGNTLSTFPSDISQNYQFIPGHGCSAALKTAGANSTAINNYYNRYQAPINNAANAHGVDPHLLAGVGIRESGLPANPDVVQPDGQGRGLFQIDFGAHAGVTLAQAFDPSFSANYAANMLSTNMATLASQHPNLNAAQLTQATAASYNFGTGNISGNPNTIDAGTTGGNYGSNVVAISVNCF